MTERSVSVEIKCCIDCKHHEVVADPDPHDSFCEDDVAVICKRSPKKPEPDSKYRADHYSFKASAVGCRPYQIRKEATIPIWCPLIKEGKMSKGKELGLIVAKARRDILNRRTVQQCKSFYAAIVEKAEEGAKLGAYFIKGSIKLNPLEEYDTTTIVNQLGLKLKAEEFQDCLVYTESDPNDEIEPGAIHLTFSFTIPEVELPVPQDPNFGF